MRTPGFRVLLAAALVGTSMSIGVVASAEAVVPLLSVHAYCYSNPERTVVHNNKGYAITIRSVGSIYKPRSNEPFSVTRSIGAHKSITFYTGTGARSSNRNTLTRQFIYNNAVGTREGARVKTSSGRVYSDRC